MGEPISSNWRFLGRRKWCIMCDKNDVIDRLMAQNNNKWKKVLSILVDKIEEYEKLIEEHEQKIQEQKKEIFRLEEEKAALLPKNRLWLKGLMHEMAIEAHIEEVKLSRRSIPMPDFPQEDEEQ